MKFQLVRTEARILGIALIFSRNTHMLRARMAPVDSHPAPAIVQTCKCDAAQAIVFCRDHCDYLCETCLSLHAGHFRSCEYLSLAAALDMLTSAKKWEAHT